MAFAACFDSSSSGQGLDASAQTFDGSFDAAGDAPSAADVSSPDAGDASPPSDAGRDAPDAADAADAGPRLDDAGCPVPTGFVGAPGDAGLPATGLALWLRADQGVATIDGGVCRWDDVSGNGRSFVPGTNTPPALDPVGIKSKPAVLFPAPSTYLQRNDMLGIAATSGRTIAVYSRTIDTTHRFQPFIQGAPGTPGTYFALDANSFNTAGSREGAYTTGNAFDSPVATTTNPRSHVLSISSMTPGGALPGVLVYSVDGVVTTLSANPGSAGVGVQDFSSATTSWIGVTSTSFSGTEVGEILVYDHALTTLERAAVEQYFLAHFP